MEAAKNIRLLRKTRCLFKRKQPFQIGHKMSWTVNIGERGHLQEYSTDTNKPPREGRTSLVSFLDCHLTQAVNSENTTHLSNHTQDSAQNPMRMPKIELNSSRGPSFNSQHPVAAHSYL